jgi:hypothetical protein
MELHLILRINNYDFDDENIFLEIITEVVCMSLTEYLTAYFL